MASRTNPAQDRERAKARVLTASGALSTAQVKLSEMEEKERKALATCKHLRDSDPFSALVSKAEQAHEKATAQRKLAQQNVETREDELDAQKALFERLLKRQDFTPEQIHAGFSDLFGDEQQRESERDDQENMRDEDGGPNEQEPDHDYTPPPKKSKPRGALPRRNLQLKTPEKHARGVAKSSKLKSFKSIKALLNKRSKTRTEQPFVPPTTDKQDAVQPLTPDSKLIEEIKEDLKREPAPTSTTNGSPGLSNAFSGISFSPVKPDVQPMSDTDHTKSSLSPPS